MNFATIQEAFEKRSAATLLKSNASDRRAVAVQKAWLQLEETNLNSFLKWPNKP